jgi:hypothetical protein
MAKKKFTELPAATTPLSGDEIIAIVQGGVSKQTTIDDLPGGGGGGAVDSVNGQTGAVSVDLQSVLEAGATAAIAGAVQVVADEGVVITHDDTATSQIANSSGNGVYVGPTSVAIVGLPLDMGTNKVTGLSAATANGDAVRYEQIVGVQDLFISAAAMWPRTTNPCADLVKTEMATSLFNVQSLDFDQTTQEFAQFQIVLPRKWNNGTVTAVVYWTATAGSGTVQWGISGGAYSNDDALTVALGTAQTSDDTLLATNDLHISPATSAITLAGTPADADFLAFQISRNPASDTLNADAKLLGVSIRVTTDNAIDA